MLQTYFNRAEKHCGTEDDEKDNIQGKKLIKPGSEKKNTWGDSKLASNCDNSGAPSDGFLLNALKSLFILSRVLLDL